MSDPKGQRVIAKVHGGKYVFARVWAVFPWAVELTADPHFRELLKGRQAPSPIPFPLDEVYCSDPIPSAEILDGRQPLAAELRIWAPHLSSTAG